MIEYAFSNYEYINIKEKINEQFEKWEKENLKNIEVIKGKSETTQIKLDNLQFDEVLINKNKIKDIKVEIICKNALQAPLQENDIIGEIRVMQKEEILTTVNILLKEKVERKNVINYIHQFITNYSNYLEQAIQAK